MPKKSTRHQDAGRGANLDPDLTIPYQTLRAFLPDLSEDDWLRLKDIALDISLINFTEFIEQLKRANQLDPKTKVTIGGLVTTLNFLLDIFKIQRAILEELKDAVSDEGVSDGAGPRKFLGAAFNEAGDDGGLLVRDVIEYTAARGSRLQRGDRLVAIGKQPITSLQDVQEAVDGLALGRKTTLTIIRGKKEHALALVPEAVVFADGDIKGANVRNKRCDDYCDCTVPRRNTGCQTVWRFRGNGPNGGLLYEKQCGALDLGNFKIIDNRSCGVAEYF